MPEVKHLTTEELDAGLDSIRQSPRDEGVLKMIVRRPAVAEREVVEEGELTFRDGLVGDNWATRGPFRPDGTVDPDTQLNVMNARVIALVAGDTARWALAGDELYVDMDLSVENLPTGTRLALGTAVIEVTAPPHTGCKKFAGRFGTAAVKFVNSPEGKKLRMRGLNARVVHPGVIRVGDVVRKA